MDMFALLIDDHRKVQGLFEEMMERDEPDKETLQTICRELALHMEKEERYLYPELQKIGEVKELAEESILEHEEAKRVMGELQKKQLKKTKLKVKAEILRLEIEHHVEEEENELFPKLEHLLSQDQLNEIAEKMERLTTQSKEKQPARR